MDGIKNGQEEGVDCGTLACGKACESPIQTVSVQNVQLAQTTVGDYDAAIQIHNPNSEYGVLNGSLDLVMGDQILSRQFYMLPGQTKFVVLSALKNIPAGVTPMATVKSVEWEKVSAPQDNPFVISRESGPSFSGGQTMYEAIITNVSNFDFDNVDVVAVVTDGAGNLITTNTSNIQTFFSKSDRSVKMTWPFTVPSGAKVHVEASTNVFNNSNFIKTNGTQEKFQQYY